MEYLKNKKRILYAAAGFFCFMFAGTLISKGIYQSTLPQVETTVADKRSIGHTVEVSGNIQQSHEIAVGAISGLKVNDIYVNTGDTVSANTLLFDIDMEDLEEKISEQELQTGKLNLTISQRQKNRELKEQETLLAQNRALEDYALADTEGNREVEQAQGTVNKAEQKAQEHAGKQPAVTSEEDRQSKTRQYNDWIQSGKDLQKQQIEAASALEAAVRAELEAYIRDKESGGAENETTPAQPIAEEPASPNTGSVSDNSNASGNNSTAGESGDADSGSDSVQQESTPDGNENGSDSDHTAIPDPVRQELERKLAEATAKKQEAQTKADDLSEAISKHQADTLIKPDYKSEDAELESWKESQKTLQDGVESAEQAKENSLWDKLDSMLEAKRKVEDSTLPEDIDASIQLNKLELSYRQQILQQYRVLKELQGGVYSEEEGIVTQVKVSVKDPVP